LTFIAEQEFYVRYAETDAMGIVHHASYIVYLEEARSHYARERGGSYAEFEATGHFLVVTEIQARYIAPARYGDKLKVRCWIEELKSRRITFAYEVLNADSGQSLMTASTQHLCVDRAGNITTIPAAWRQWSL
jgi:acyl-CoA thioester hydrolase